jgi:GAF domain-containing protein
VPLGIEVALAFGTGVAAFALVGVTVAASDASLLLVVGLGAVYLAAVVAMTRFWGVAYAVPAAMAALLAYDWFYFPPTHPHEFPASEVLVDLIVYLVVAAAIGQLAAYASRRADVSEVARSALAEEQAALRRVAELVARGVPPGVVFAAVAEELGILLQVDGARVVRYDGGDEIVQLAGWAAPGCESPPQGRQKLERTSVSSEVLRTGRVARIDDYASVSPTMAHIVAPLGIKSAVGAPIVVDGRLWGAMLAWYTQPEPLPDTAEARLADFTELVATAISNTTGREQLARLADEQAALRRVATLVARECSPAEVFAAVAREVGQLLDVDATHMARYEPDGTTTGVASWTRSGEEIPIGRRSPVEGTNVSALVLRTGRPARLDSYEDASGPIAAMLRELGIRSTVGGPIVVDSRLWGVMGASSKREEPLPTDTEARITAFTELVATAISNTDARTQVKRLADEQAALRRVATLVAHGLPPGELFDAVAAEVGGLLGADMAGMLQYDAGDTVASVASWVAEGEHVQLGGQRRLEPGTLAATIARTCRPARIDDWAEVAGARGAFARDELGIGSSVGSPIVVEGRVWGALIVHSRHAGMLRGDTESRLASFTELVATAMSNAEARAEVRRLVDEQSALRRVATLVARESSPGEVFTAVAEEVGRLLGVEHTSMFRYEDDGTVTVVGDSGEREIPLPVGTRMTLDGDNVTALVRRTGMPARVDDYEDAGGALGHYARDVGIGSAIGTPIFVEGRLWGAMVAVSPLGTSLPAGTGSRVAEFTELVGTAICNVETRSHLAASRARIVAATDEERRRVVRDLHDGAQQRLVHTVITLKLARRALDRHQETAPALVSEALDHAQQATAEMRELAHGILPSVLTHGGLRAAVEALASRMRLPVDIAVSADRLTPAVEATAYFVVAEALTNVAKHSGAAHAAVTARADDGLLRVQVRDDGVGGARPDGSGLLGLADRLAVLEGWLEVESPTDGGTLVAAAIPLAAGLPES